MQHALLEPARRARLGWAVGLPVLAMAAGLHAMPVTPLSTIPLPVDHAFKGQIDVSVDARDTAHKVFRVHEVIPAQATGAVTLLYPEWELFSHARTISAASVAGLTIEADGHPLDWVRDSVDMHAFHVVVPSRAQRLDVDF
ncbi:hypothetical protein [Xanthomonas sp. NCPPB 2632]|uniref:M61 family metallopeptidase n=1 Tax=Xanthomonas sp. NCPPB 2632 TaxID=3240912 RepID=UPI003510F185